MPTGHEIAMSLRAAYWAMHRGADALFLEFGVTADQFVLLSLLAGEDGVTQQDLVRRASSDANTVRAMLLLLEKDGLVSRRPHPTDGRARTVRLTPKGRRTFARLRANSESFRLQLRSAFTPTEAAAFVNDLNHIASTMNPAAWAQRSRAAS